MPNTENTDLNMINFLDKVFIMMITRYSEKSFLLFFQNTLDDQTYRYWSIEDAQCMICGRVADIKRHLGIVCKALVKLGDNPKSIFCTRTFSNICNKEQKGRVRHESSCIVLIGWCRIIAGCKLQGRRHR